MFESARNSNRNKHVTYVMIIELDIGSKRAYLHVGSGEFAKFALPFFAGLRGEVVTHFGGNCFPLVGLIFTYVRSESVILFFGVNNGVD